MARIKALYSVETSDTMHRNFRPSHRPHCAQAFRKSWAEGLGRVMRLCSDLLRRLDVAHAASKGVIVVEPSQDPLFEDEDLPLGLACLRRGLQ